MTAMDSTIYHIGTERQLMVDSLLIECTQAVTRRWHAPVRHEAPLIVADRPWEKLLYFTYSNYCVIHDPLDGKYKCWYEDLGVMTAGDWHPVLTRLCYAESTDGLHFVKPELDTCLIDGQRTNIVMGHAEGAPATAKNPWAEVGVHSNGIVLDPHPARPEERFRTIFSRSFREQGRLRHVIECAHSADGLVWQPYPQPPTIGSSGSHLSDVSCLHYDEDARLFVQNTRHGCMYAGNAPADTPNVCDWFGPYYPHRPDLMNKRRVFQTRSHDFLHWTDPILVSSPDDAIDNLDEAHYGMGQFRVGRHQFGTLGVFRFVANEMDVRLLYSRDGIHFTTTNRAQPFLAPRGEGYWDTHMVSITSAPVERDGEWWFYHGGTNSHHDWWMAPTEHIDAPEARDPAGQVRFGLGLAKLRQDGVASLAAAAQRPGYLLTRPLMSPGDRLIVNARCRPGGSLKVAVLGRSGEVLRELAACDPFTGDAVAHTVSWGGDPVVPGANAWRKLRFDLHDAELFSFRLVRA